MKADSAIRAAVRRRAGDRCEYRGLRQSDSETIHHLEHIVAKQHGGSDDLENLAWACHRCNRSKGPNVAGVDPVSGGIVPLFHPRQQDWDEHFRWSGVHIEGLTACGRATVRIFGLNDGRRIEWRTELSSRNAP